MSQRDLKRPPLDSAFDSVKRQVFQLLEYANTVSPVVQSKREFVAEFADGMIVLLAIRLDGFFNGVVSLGTQHREQTVRRELLRRGDKYKHARHCDLITLIKLARGLISYEDGGKKLDSLFRLMFKCSVWPSDEVRDIVLDFILLRNLVVHNGGTDWSQDGVVGASYACQFRRADVLKETRYGQFATYRVDPYKAALFVRDALLAIIKQLEYLEGRLVKDTTWMDTSPTAKPHP